MSRARQRRARRRADIQLSRKAIRRGVCPCEDHRIENPGPTHIPSCLWNDDGYTGPCFCGEVDPHYSRSLARSCGGFGELRCRCGGDICICHHHGGVECLGCEDCEYDDDGDFDAVYDEDEDTGDYVPETMRGQL